MPLAAHQIATNLHFRRKHSPKCQFHTSKGFTHMSATTKAPGLESPRKKLHSLFSQFPSKRFTALYSLSKPDEPWEGRNASLVCNNMPYLPFL